MVGLATDDIPEPVEVCHDDEDAGIQGLLATLFSRDEDAIWASRILKTLMRLRICAHTWCPQIPLSGNHLSNVFVELAQYPGTTLVKVGPVTQSRGDEPIYVARAVYRGFIVPAYCGFHLQGARAILDGRAVVVQQFEVLVSNPGEYQWQQVAEGDQEAGSGMHSAVCGGVRRSPEGLLEDLRVFRWRGDDGQWVCGPIEVDEAPPKYHPQHSDSNLSSKLEVLIRADITSTVPSNMSPDPTETLKAAVTLGAYWTDNHWTHVIPAGHNSSAVHFTEPLQGVPKIIVGLSKLDMGHNATGATIRVRSWPQNVTRESFICNAQTWADTTLYNASVDWAAIEEGDWQCGVLHTTDFRDWGVTDSLFDHRIGFQTPFTSPPMVLVCFNGFDMCGNWNLRTYATNVDHTGFNLSIVKSDDGDISTKLWTASISWVAIPGSEVLKRRNAWIGQFSTAGMGDIGKAGSCHGHVDFGVKFDRPPKVFLGLNHFRLRNSANLRLFSETSNVTESGMDWNIWRWDDTVLEGASVMYLAVDDR